MADNGAGSQRFKSLTQQLEAYMAETEEDRRKMQQEKADLKKKEDGIRDALQAEFNKKEKALQEMFDKKQEELQRKWETREAEMKDWEEEKERVKQTKVFEKVVTLDVGGTKYRTTLSTLTRYPDSMLGAMFSGRHNLPQQEDGSYFIDRDGEVFKYVLMYLRDRDLCFDYLHDESLRHSTDLSSLPSPVENRPLKQIACEAKYFQFGEWDTKVQIILNAIRRQYRSYESQGYHDYSRYEYLDAGLGLQTATYSPPICCELDYGQDKLQCGLYCNSSRAFTYCITERNLHLSSEKNGKQFMEKVTFESCDLSGVTFRNCYFQKGVSFEGCILRGTKFEHVGGLVRHKVHFAPWQVAQADFEPELLQALKDNRCIY